MKELDNNAKSIFTRKCAKNGDFLKYGNGVGTAIAYAWYIWEKGYQEDTIIK